MRYNLVPTIVPQAVYDCIEHFKVLLLLARPYSLSGGKERILVIKQKYFPATCNYFYSIYIITWTSHLDGYLCSYSL